MSSRREGNVSQENLSRHPDECSLVFSPDWVTYPVPNNPFDNSGNTCVVEMRASAAMVIAYSGGYLYSPRSTLVKFTKFPTATTQFRPGIKCEELSNNKNVTGKN